MRPLMVLGCTSDAGKSLVTAGLCRWFARQGVRVAPFKAQNMSNNARVVEGGEIGVAQWLQARAAQVEPELAMNPVLIKPEADTRSQVVVRGRAAPELHAVPWEERGAHLWPAMVEGFNDLSSRFDLVVLEGAGSPAEINLVDLVNNRMVLHADAAALLVSDIDRGGSFAHLVGTHALAPATTQDRLAGFVLNKFRGDAGLLAPAPEYVERLTGMHFGGVLPMLAHELPDEEGGTVRARPPAGAPVVAIPRFPWGSNIDEFHLLGHVAELRFVDRPGDLRDADVVILPGSKHVAADIEWLRDRKMDQVIVERHRRGQRTIGVCGGAMMLGAEIADPDSIEGAARGLGIVDSTTRMDRDKTVRTVQLTPSGLDEPWQALNGLTVSGYEIRNGQTDMLVAAGPTLATTVHGLFESPDVLHALFGRRPPAVLDTTFELLADAIDEHLDTDWLLRTVDASR